MPGRGVRRAALAASIIAVTVVPSLCWSGTRGADPGGKLRLKVGEFDPVRETPQVPEHLVFPGEPSSGAFIVQFHRSGDSALIEDLRSLGVELLKYLPDSSYLVRLPEGKAAAVRALRGVRWLGALQPGWKIAPDLGARLDRDVSLPPDERLKATVELLSGENPAVAAERVRATGALVDATIRAGRAHRLRIRATSSEIESIARIPSVAWIEETGVATLRNNTTRWVIQTDVTSSTTVWDHGLHGEGQIVGIIDGVMDIDSCYFTDPDHAFPSPDHRKVVARLVTNPNAPVDTHGTHVAGIVAGDQYPINATIENNGNADGAKIHFLDYDFINGSGTQTSTLYRFLGVAYGSGARIHTNSWGDDGTTAYTTWCVDIDEFSYDYEESLVLFAVTNTSTLRTPENAKNVLAVGATRNGASDDLFCSGGRGPTNDGRRKPEIFAPGCSIVSARSSQTCGTLSLTGTSMASPAVAAAGALARQYFAEGWYPSGVAVPADSLQPSGALVKATLLNSAVDMTGVTGYPSDQEGWGRVLLENALYFDGDVRKLSVLGDVRNAVGLATGESTDHTLVVEGQGEPLRVTLVWTEPPASLLASSASVNDLDLEVVSPAGTVYLGNVFDTGTGFSLAGGSRDSKNNVEMVALSSPATGTWTVRVKGTSVNEARQGYALVAAGQVVPSRPALVAYDSHVVDDAPPLGNGDGLADPGETVSMPMSLRNAGSISLTGLSGSLSSDRGDWVKITEDLASFPDLAPDAVGPSSVPHFRYTVSPDAACGTTVSFRTDADSDQGSAAAAFPVEIGKASLEGVASDTPLGIPANSSTPVTSTIQITDSFALSRVNVGVDILFTDVGKLVVTLTSPGGTEVTLHDESHDANHDLVTVYDRDRIPDGPGTMSDFIGESAQGTWTLLAHGAPGALAGQLRAWSLFLESQSPLSCSPLSCAEPVPAAVPNGLTVNKENGSDLRFDWPPLAGASSYRIWRSSAPPFSEESLLGAVVATTHVEFGGGADATTEYYVVRAVNSCEWEGP